MPPLAKFYSAWLNERKTKMQTRQPTIIRCTIKTETQHCKNTTVFLPKHKNSNAPSKAFISIISVTFFGFVFGGFNLRHKDWLTYSGETN